MPKTYKSIFISDLHLGSKSCNADSIIDFLKNNTCDNLFLVGDIIDGWRLSRKFYWPQNHTNVIRRILTASKRDTQVIYIIGNHDEVIRDVLPFTKSFGNIELANYYRYSAVDGRTYLVVHGDMFDNVLRTKLKWLYHLGDFFYDVLIVLNRYLAHLRRWLRRPYWSLSAYLKNKTKEAVSYLNKFEELIVEYCEKKKAHGIICGHTHSAKIKEIDGIWYFNDGDFVESVSALVETHTGDWILIHLEGNEWRPFQVLDRQTDQILTGELCIPWFERKGFSVLRYQDLDSQR